MDQYASGTYVMYPKPDAYPKEHSGIVKTYYYWQLGTLYIGGVPVGWKCDDDWLNSILAKLLKLRPSDGFVKTEIILT